MGDLQELRDRLTRASRALRDLARDRDWSERVRLLGKADGVLLATTFVDEILREAESRTQQSGESAP